MVGDRTSFHRTSRTRCGSRHSGEVGRGNSARLCLNQLQIRPEFFPASQYVHTFPFGRVLDLVETLCKVHGKNKTQFVIAQLLTDGVVDMAQTDLSLAESPSPLSDEQVANTSAEPFPEPFPPATSGAFVRLIHDASPQLHKIDGPVHDVRGEGARGAEDWIRATAGTGDLAHFDWILTWPVQSEVVGIQEALIAQHRRREGAQSDSTSSMSLGSDPPHGRSVRSQHTSHSVDVHLLVETGRADLGAFLFLDALTQFTRSLLAGGFEGFLDCIGKSIGGELLGRYGCWSSTSASDHGTPERLVAEERDNDSRSAQRDTRGCCTGAAMVHHTGHVLEKPVVRAIAEHEDAFGFV